MDSSNLNNTSVMVQLTKSCIGCLPKHKRILGRLNLKKIGRIIFINATQNNIGMLNKIFYLVKVKRVVF